MALIAPNSDVWLCRGIPFDAGYRFTGAYPDINTQGAMIQTKAFFHAPKCTYIRQRSAIRLEIPIADCYDANYIMYINNDFEKRFFFGFITYVRYVSNTVTEFGFEEDILNSWYFNYYPLECYIERTHVTDDTPGRHIIPEGLETGDFIAATIQQIPVSKNKIYVAATFDKNLNNYYGGMQNNVYSGLCINEFDNAAQITAFINSATSANKLDGIVQVFQAINYNTISNLTINQDKTTLFEGYTPQNNKLYTYPYSFLQVLGNDGGNAIFKWEYANQFGVMPFQINVSPSLGSQMMITPTAYQNVQGYNPLQRMIIENVLLCSWNGDTFKANLAQTIGRYAAIAETAANTVGAATSALSTPSNNEIIGINKSNGEQKMVKLPSNAMFNQGIGTFTSGIQAVNAITKDLTGSSISEHVENTITPGIQSFFRDISNILKAVKAPESMSRQAQNPGGSTDILYMIGVKAPYFVQMGIRRKYAEIIDNYFTMFGYQVNQRGLPNRRNRARFTYVKTMDCVIKGNLPAQIANQIQAIYNNGTTFWYLDGQPGRMIDNVGYYGGNTIDL